MFDNSKGDEEMDIERKIEEKREKLRRREKE